MFLTKKKRISFLMIYCFLYQISHNKPKVNNKKENLHLIPMDEKKPPGGDISEKNQSNRNDNQIEKLSKSNNLIKLQNLYLLEEFGIFELPQVIEKEFLIFEIKGVSIIEIEIWNKTQKLIQSSEFNIVMENILFLVPFNMKDITGFEDGQLKIILKEKNVLEKDVFVRLINVEYIKMDFFNILTVFPIFSDSLKVKVTSKTPLSNSEKIQFVLNPNFIYQSLKGDESVAMLINKGDIFPTTNNYEMAGLKGKSNITKTILPESDHYCNTSECLYSITLLFKNIELLIFLPLVENLEKEIPVKKELQFFHELEVGKNLTIVLILEENDKLDWLFSIEPNKGNPDFYINPDTLPDKFENYRYKGTADGIEQVIITNYEREKLKYTFKKVFVTFKGEEKENVSFLFRAKAIENNERKFISEEFVESGEIVENEIINYTLMLKPKTDQSETFNLNLELKSFEGNADIYVKECSRSFKNCSIEKSDIESSQITNNSNNEKIFKFSKNDPKNGESDKTDLINLNFNCLPTDTIKSFANNYPTSRSCIFVIGVFCPQIDVLKEKGNSAFFRLSTKGQDILSTINLRESTSLRIFRNSKINLQTNFDDDEIKKFKFMVFRVISLNGDFVIYFSKNNSDPDEKDHDDILEVKGDNSPILKSKLIEKNILLDHLANHTIFFTIQAKEYTVLEIYVDIVQDLEEELSEIIKINSFLNRIISRERFYSNDTDIVYYKNFYFEFNDQLVKNNFLEIMVNTNQQGLQICVQKNNKKFDFKSACDFETNLDNINIPIKASSINSTDIFQISVQKKLKLNEIFTQFPLEFSITINVGEFHNPINPIRPGQLYILKLQPRQTIQHIVSFAQMQKNGFILSYSSSNYLKVKIKNTNSFSKILSNFAIDDFAFLINDIVDFKLNYFPLEEVNFNLLVEITNSSENTVRSILCYSYDGIPIALKEGYTMGIPSNRDLFLIQETSPDLPLSFSYTTNGTNTKVLAKIFDRDKLDDENFDKFINSSKYDFQTSFAQKGMLYFERDLLKDFQPPVVVFLTQEDVSQKKELKKNLTLSKKYMTLVSVHNKVKNLEPFSLFKTEITKDDFAYFNIIAENNSDFSVFMNVISGEADLYINPGMFNLTTTDLYWKRKNTYKGEEIAIKKEEFSDERKPQSSYAFTVGVYAKEGSEVSILYAPNFENLVNLKNQELIDLDLSKGKEYLFDFYKEDNVKLYAYCEFSDVELNLISFDETSGVDLIDIIIDKENLIKTMVLTNRGLPQEIDFKELGLKNGHFIISLKSRDEAAKISLVVYDEKLPIEIYSEKRFTFAMKAKKSKIFEVKLDGNYQDVDIDIKTNFGEINFAVSSKKELFDNFQKVAYGEQKYSHFQLKQNSLNLFNTIYVQINSFIFSEFSLLIKPKEKFKRLVAFQIETIFTDKDKDLYLYYQIPKSTFNQIENITFDIFKIMSFTNKPEMLFLSELKDISNGDNKFIAMPILQYNTKKLGEFEHLLIQPEKVKGYYIIKFPKTNESYPVKISVSLNSDRLIENNQNFWENSKKEQVNYFLYIPESGSLNLSINSCDNVQIDNIFLSSNENNKLKIDENSVKKFSIISYNDMEKKQTEVNFQKKMKKIEITNPGLLQFQTKYFSEEKKKKNINYNYFLETEFKTENKYNFFGDYILIDSEKFNFDIKFNKEIPGFEYEFSDPVFVDQLFVDFPKLDSIILDYKFYVLDNQNFIKEFEKCGMDIVQNFSFFDFDMKKNLKVSELKDNKNISRTKFLIDVKKLEKLKKNVFQIFGFIQIFFVIDSEKDEFLSLYQKYTLLPYFIITLPNQTNKNLKTNLYYFITGSFILFIILGIVIFVIRRKQKNDNKKEFNNVEDKSIIPISSENSRLNVISLDGDSKDLEQITINESSEKFNVEDKIKIEEEDEENEIEV